MKVKSRDILLIIVVLSMIVFVSSVLINKYSNSVTFKYYYADNVICKGKDTGKEDYEFVNLYSSEIPDDMIINGSANRVGIIVFDYKDIVKNCNSFPDPDNTKLRLLENIIILDDEESTLNFIINYYLHKDHGKYHHIRQNAMNTNVVSTRGTLSDYNNVHITVKPDGVRLLKIN